MALDVLKIIAMFIFGMAAAIIGFLEIKKEANRPWLVILSSILMAGGVIGFAIFSQALFLILVLIGIILIFSVG